MVKKQFFLNLHSVFSFVSDIVLPQYCSASALLGQSLCCLQFKGGEDSFLSRFQGFQFIIKWFQGSSIMVEGSGRAKLFTSWQPRNRTLPDGPSFLTSHSAMNVTALIHQYNTAMTHSPLQESLHPVKLTIKINPHTTTQFGSFVFLGHHHCT